MKSWTIRLPEEVYDWVREKAAMESIRLKKNKSMNSIAVEILSEAMERDKEGGNPDGDLS